MATTVIVIIVIAAISGFVLVPKWRAAPSQNPPHRRANYRSTLKELAAGFGDLSKAVCAPFEPTRAGGNEPPSSAYHIGEAQPRIFAFAARHDAKLLRERMKLLRIDPDEFACTDPVTIRQLTICCIQCGSTADCARDLSDPLTGSLGAGWEDYCPNAALLKTVSALRAAGISSLPGASAGWPPASDETAATVTRH